MSVVVDEIERRIGAAAVLRGDSVAERAVGYWDSSPMSALAIVRPRTTGQVSEILSLCYAAGQSVVTHGGRTGCVAGTTSSASDLVLSLERMNRICEIDPLAGTVTAEAGAVLQTVQEEVRAAGFMLPLDLGARGSCTIGGNLATNAGGINVIRYGMARAITLGLEAVLPDGRVVSSLDKMLKNNAGFDLKQLFIGTEGTLGVITRAVLRLQPAPLSKNTAMAAVADFDRLTRLLNRLQARLGGNLSAFEMMEGAYFRAVTEPGWHTAPMDRQHPYYVIWEADGSDPARDDEHFQEVLEAAFEDGLIEDAVLPASESQRQHLWAIRDDFEAILQPEPVFLYDVSLSIGSIERYVSEVKGAAESLLPGSTVYAIGHVGDSNLHFFVQARSDAADARERSDRAVYEPLKKYGGSISAEHGIGTEKKRWLEQSRSPEEIELMQLLKRAIDPRGSLNPGVVID
ncbi:MAG: FAD-binding oxidoreductase [Pseudomonadota bacterium]